MTETISNDDASYAFDLVKKICTEVGPGLPGSEKEQERAAVFRQELALHLGADRVFIVGTGRQGDDLARARSSVYPSLAQIAGHALNSIFLDTLMVDLERLERINRTLSAVPPEALSSGRVGLKPVKVLFLSPSQSIERIAVRFLHELPRTVLFILRPTGALNRSGSNLASYLLFEEGFCRALIDLGYQDTMSRSDEVRAFFDDQ
jgi:NTE family protein